MPLEGWFEGEQIARDNNLRQAQFGLEQQRTQASMELQQAEAQQMQTANQESQLKLKNEQRLQDALMQKATQDASPTPPQQGPQGGQKPPPPVEDSLQQAKGYEDLLWNLGLPEKALNAAKAVSKLQLDAQHQLTAQEEQASKQLQQRQSMLKSINAMYAGVTSPQDYARAQAMIGLQYPGFKDPMAGQPYSPQLVEQIRQGTAEGLKKLEQEGKEQNNKSLDKERQSAEAFRAWREGFAEKRAKVMDVRREAKAKEGGSQVAYPSKEAIKQAETAIKQAHPDLPEDEVHQYAFDRASAAKAMTTRNKGLDPSTALQRALADPAHSQDIKTVNAAYKNIWDKLAPEWMGGGAKPLEHYAPASKAGGPTPGTVVDGYRFKGGDPNSKASWEAADDGEGDDE